MIVAAATAEHTILESSFFRQYLDQSVETQGRHSIQATDIPSEVMQSFMQSPYKDLSIYEVQKIEKYPLLMPLSWLEKVDKFVPFNAPKPETQYILSLGNQVGKSIVTVVRFDYKGKLIDSKCI